MHRWAARFVVEELDRPVPDRPGEAELLRGGPADDELLSWFSAGHAGLVSALRAADPGLSCWTFLEAPSPLAFWARRQAHETAIHRVDAELAGGAPAPFPADFAADGVDELIMGFFGRDADELTAPQWASRRQRLTVRRLTPAAAGMVELTDDGKLAARSAARDRLSADDGRERRVPVHADRTRSWPVPAAVEPGRPGCGRSHGQRGRSGTAGVVGEHARDLGVTPTATAAWPASH